MGLLGGILTQRTNERFSRPNYARCAYRPIKHLACTLLPIPCETRMKALSEASQLRADVSRREEAVAVATAAASELSGSLKVERDRAARAEVSLMATQAHHRLPNKRPNPKH